MCEMPSIDVIAGAISRISLSDPIRDTLSRRDENPPRSRCRFIRESLPFSLYENILFTRA